MAGLSAVTGLVDAARIKNFIITQLAASLQWIAAAQSAGMITLAGVGVWLENVAISREPSPLKALLKDVLD